MIALNLLRSRRRTFLHTYSVLSCDLFLERFDLNRGNRYPVVNSAVIYGQHGLSIRSFLLFVQTGQSRPPNNIDTNHWRTQGEKNVM